MTTVKSVFLFAPLLVVSFGLVAPLSAQVAPATGDQDNKAEKTQVAGEGGGSAEGDEFFAGSGSDLKASTCESANRDFLIKAGIVDVLAMVLFFLSLWLVARQDWLRFLGGGTLQFFVIHVPFMLSAWGFLWYFRARSNLIARCVASPEFEDLVMVAGWDAWVVGAVFGALPVLGLSVVGKVGHSMFFD